MARKTSEFYKIRSHQVRLNPERTAELLGVTVDQIHELFSRGVLRWKIGW